MAKRRSKAKPKPKAKPVTIKAGGTYKQGTKTTAGTIKYDAKTGRLLNKGQSTTTYGSGRTSSGEDNVVRYDKYTGELLGEGESFYDQDTGQTVTQGTKFGAMTPNDLSSAEQVQLPEAPTPIDPGGLAMANNAGLATGGLSLKDGIFSFEPPEATTGTAVAEPAGDNFKQIFSDYLGLKQQVAPPNLTKIYEDERRAAGISAKEQEVQNYSNQLNAITAKAQADTLAVTGQGRGIPEVIIGGQQAQINKEAAIAALPVQAQLAAAQGNLEVAERHVETMFKLKSQDAQAQYEFKNKVIDSVFEFANAQESRRLADIRYKNEQNFTLLQKDTDHARNLASYAMQNGDAASAVKLGQLEAPDPSSRTFKADLAKYNAEVAKIQGTFKPDREFELKLRSQDFQEKMAQKTYDQQAAALEATLKGTLDKSTQEANKLFADTDEAKSVTVIKGQIATMDEAFISLVETADRAMDDSKWKTISKDSSVVELVANAEARVRNPELNRLAQGGDLNAEKALVAQISQNVKKYGGGSAGSVNNIKQAVRVIDSAYRARVKEADLALARIKTLYPESPVLTTYAQVNNGTPLKTKISEAVKKTGAKPTQIINYLKDDPIVGPQISTALSAGYTPLQVFNYLQNQ